MIPRYERPAAVTSVVVFECLRAAILLLIELSLFLSPGQQLAHRKSVEFLIYIAAGHSLLAAPFSVILLPLFALYFLIVGAGLWMLQTWARAFLIVTSGATIFLWIRYLALAFFVFHNSVLKTHLQRDALFILLLLDAFVFAQLALSPGVKQAFRNR